MNKIFFQTTDGLNLCALHEKNNSDTCVVMCHGIRGNKEEVGNFTKLVKILNSMGIDSFRFDFRGHGESQGEFVDVTITKEVDDLDSALMYLKSFNYKNIILLGASFGAQAVSLLDYDNYKNIKGIIFWYPALRIQKTDLFTKDQYEESKEKGYVEIWNMSHTKVFRLGFNLMEECLNIKAWEVIEENAIPKIFIHGDSDKNVDIEFNSIIPSKKTINSNLVVIKEGVHNFSRVDENIVDEGIRETIKFIESLNLKNKQITREAHDSIANKYYELYKDDISDLKYFDMFLNNCKNKLLDLGCGMGHYSNYMYSKGFNVTGIDFSVNMINIAKNMNPKIDFIVSDISDLSCLGNKKYDGIVIAYVLQHLSKHEVVSLFSELNKYINNNSRMLLFLREGDDILEEIEPIDDNYKYIINEYSKNEINDLLRVFGWEIEFIETKKFTYDPNSLSPVTMVVIANKKEV